MSLCLQWRIKRSAAKRRLRLTRRPTSSTRTRSEELEREGNPGAYRMREPGLKTAAAPCSLARPSSRQDERRRWLLYRRRGLEHDRFDG